MGKFEELYESIMNEEKNYVDNIKSTPKEAQEIINNAKDSDDYKPLKESKEEILQKYDKKREYRIWKSDDKYVVMIKSKGGIGMTMVAKGFDTIEAALKVYKDADTTDAENQLQKVSDILKKKV